MDDSIPINDSSILIRLPIQPRNTTVNYVPDSAVKQNPQVSGQYRVNNNNQNSITSNFVNLDPSAPINTIDARSPPSNQSPMLIR